MSVEQAQTGKGQDEDRQVNPGFNFMKHNLRKTTFSKNNLGTIQTDFKLQLNY